MHDPELWDVYAAGLDELFTAMPAVDGLMIRIGEDPVLREAIDYRVLGKITDEDRRRNSPPRG